MYLDNKICTCGNCRKSFKLNERKIVTRKFLGVSINEKVCPFCESTGYSQEAFVKWLTNKYENLNW